MSDKAEQVLAAIMQRVLDGVDTATEFAKQEIPEVIQQLLVWHFWEATIWACIGVAMLVSYRWIFAWLKSLYLLEYSSTGDGSSTIAAGGVCSAVYIGFAIHKAFSALTALKIAIAPKLYLLEYGASLVK